MQKVTDSLFTGTKIQLSDRKDTGGYRKPATEDDGNCFMGKIIAADEIANGQLKSLYNRNTDRH